MTNIHPEARSLINPELATPKYLKHKIEEENLYRKFQTLAGTEKTSEFHQAGSDTTRTEKLGPHLVES